MVLAAPTSCIDGAKFANDIIEGARSLFQCTIMNLITRIYMVAFHYLMGDLDSILPPPTPPVDKCTSANGSSGIQLHSKHTVVDFNYTLRVVSYYYSSSPFFNTKRHAEIPEGKCLTLTYKKTSHMK